MERSDAATPSEERLNLGQRHGLHKKYLAERFLCCTEEEASHYFLCKAPTAAINSNSRAISCSEVSGSHFNSPPWL
jgi:hypothetical protein